MDSDVMAAQAGGKALTWIAAKRQFFDPYRASEVAKEPAQTALSELALMDVILRPRLAKPSAARTQLDQCMEVINAVYSRSDFHSFPFVNEPLAFTGHLVIWLALTNAGFQTPLSHDDFQSALLERNITYQERLPYMALELRYFCDLAGLNIDSPSVEELYKRTLLAQDFDPVSLMTRDIYHITHTIFYVTDYGRREFSALTRCGGLGVDQLTKMLFDFCIEQEDWDLLAEVLLTRYCAGLTTDEADAQGWLALVKQQLSDGMINHPIMQYQAQEAVDETLIFERAYHRTLLTALTGLLVSA